MRTVMLSVPLMLVADGLGNVIGGDDRADGDAFAFQEHFR